MPELFQHDEDNLPGIERRDWWETRPRAEGEKDQDGYYEAELAWVLDKSTRYCMSYCRQPGYEGWQPDMARGWSIMQNGLCQSVTREEFAQFLQDFAGEFFQDPAVVPMIKVQTADGFWSVKI